MNFKLKLSEYIGLIEERLYEIIENSTKQELQKSVTEAMLYSASAGGKRIRPVLTLAFCEANGADSKAALDFAAAVEMIHCYSLIHDDLPCMDNDDMRRGKPSCHKAFGEDTALLAGDGLLTLAFETLSSAKLGAQQIVAAVKTLSAFAGVDGMIGGQVIDLSFSCSGKECSQEVLELLHLQKTSKLIMAACVLGCIAADADSASLESAKLFGKNLGLAFQIQDDILDVEGNAEELGKPIGSDEKNNKSTYVSVYGIDKCRERVNLLTKEAVDCLKNLDGNTDFIIELANSLICRRS